MKHLAGPPSRRTLLVVMSALLVLSASVHAAVTLVEFKAERQSPTSARVTWRTATEIDTISFFLWRADAEGGAFQQIQHFESRGTGVSGADYEYVDTGLQPNANYWYRLEDLDGSQASTYHGPISIDQPITATATPTTAPASTATPTMVSTATPTDFPTATATLIPTSTPTGITTGTPATPTQPAPTATSLPTTPPVTAAALAQGVTPSSTTALPAVTATAPAPAASQAAPLVVSTVTPTLLPAGAPAEPAPTESVAITRAPIASNEPAAVAAAPGMGPGEDSPGVAAGQTEEPPATTAGGAFARLPKSEAQDKGEDGGTPVLLLVVGVLSLAAAVAVGLMAYRSSRRRTTGDKP